MRNRFADVFYELGKDDPRLCIVVADISPAGSIAQFRTEFPDRFVNTGVAEQIMIGMCAGMAQRGLRPFAYTIATFTLYRPFEFVRDDLCYQGLPVTIVGIGGGVTYSTLGATHHAMEDVAIASALPNMRVIAPCDPLEAEAATRWCATQEEGPVYLRLGKAGEPVLTESAEGPWEFGRLRRLARGRDVCVIGYGPLMKMAANVARRFADSGRSTSLVSCHTLKPLDEDGIAELLREHDHVVVIEETTPAGALGGKVKQIAWDTSASCRIDSFCLRDEFIHVYGTHDDVLEAHGLSEPAISGAWTLPVPEPSPFVASSEQQDAGVLAVDGGVPVRAEPMPARFAIGPEERRLLEEALDYYQGLGLDPGYQGPYEARYCDAFTAFHGGGFADAVATGTLAVYVAIAALDLARGSEVLVSPITDPGTLGAIMMAGLVPRLVDSAPGSFNTDVEQLAVRVGPETRAMVLVHSVGMSLDMPPILALAREHGLRVVEDCSQSHGARDAAGALAGTHGDIAAFSTMYRKASITGSSGGVVYTRDESLARRALAHADRGKPRWLEEFDDRDPATFLFPALNLHTDELSCAMGIASLARLPSTISARLDYVRGVAAGLRERSRACRLHAWSEGDSPFALPVVLDEVRAGVDRATFAGAILAEGIGLSTHYRYLVADWPFIQPHLADDFDCPNARAAIERTFCLYLNENYGEREVRDTVAAIEKVETAYARPVGGESGP